MLARIRGTADIEAEFREIQQSVTKAPESGRFSDLFTRAIRPALVVGIGLAIFQQITGINTVIYYAPVIIQSAGISSASGAILATAGIGAGERAHDDRLDAADRSQGTQTLAADRYCRDGGYTGTSGICVSRVHQTATIAWLAVISMMAYVASFAISLGRFFWLLISEIYPLKIRNSAEGLAATFNWGANLLVTLTFLTLVEKLGPSQTFWFYGVCAIAAGIFSYYFVPETKGRTLEEIEEFLHAKNRLAITPKEH